MQPTYNKPSAQAVEKENEFKYPFWYLKGRTVFGAKKGTAILSPGLIRVIDANNQEVYRITTNSSINIKRSFGVVQIKSIDGQKMRKIMPYRRSIFYFYNPALMLFSYWFMLKGKNIAANFKQNIEYFAGVK